MASVVKAPLLFMMLIICYQSLFFLVSWDRGLSIVLVAPRGMWDLNSAAGGKPALPVLRVQRLSCWKSEAHQFYWSFQRTSFQCCWFFSVDFLFAVSLVSALIFIISFFLLTLDLICFSFFSFLRRKLILLSSTTLLQILCLLGLSVSERRVLTSPAV